MFLSFSVECISGPANYEFNCYAFTDVAYMWSGSLAASETSNVFMELAIGDYN